MDGVVVIGEGEKDEAPMLYNGEHVGDGKGPDVDVAVDPLEGTTLIASGMPNALAVVAIAEQGAMFDPGPCVYMEKIAGGPDIADLLSLEDPIEDVLERVAEQRGVVVGDLMVVHPRPSAPRRDGRADPPGRRAHPLHLRRRRRRRAARRARGHRRRPAVGHRRNARGRALGRRHQVPRRGDLGAPLAARRGRGQPGPLGRLRPRPDPDTDDLVAGDNCFFAATGVTDGNLLDGVRYDRGGAVTQSMVMRASSGTVRLVDARHDRAKLRSIAGERYG